MLQGHDIVCFANDWDSDPLSKKHIMKRLAEHNRVLWVDSLGCRNPQASVRDLRRAFGKVRAFYRGCRHVQERLWVLSPLVLPFHGSRFARAINRRWLVTSLRRTCRKLGMHRPITWTFIPSSADVAGRLSERLLVYHCVDEFSQFTGTDATAMEEMEGRLAAAADLVVVSAATLCASKSRHNANTFLVTHGVDVEHFRQALDPATAVPGDVPRGTGPVIGFFGLLADWVDLELVRYLALARPGFRIVLIGKADTDLSALKDVPNVSVLGPRTYASLPGYCKGFDVAILPFRINALTLASNPLKVREYLAAGLPVVATAIPEAARLSPPVRIAQSHEEFLRHVDDVIASGATGPQPAISETVRHESWDDKVEQLSFLLAGFLERGPRPASGEKLTSRGPS